MKPARTRRLAPLAVAAGLLCGAPAEAAVRTWICDFASFQDPGCWLPLNGSVPGMLDDVYINGRPLGASGFGAYVLFDASSGTRVLSSLNIDEPGTSPTSAVFVQEGGSLTTGSVLLGGTGGGELQQFGGTHAGSVVRVGGSTRPSALQLSGGDLNINRVPTANVSIGGGIEAAPSTFAHYGGNANITIVNVGSGGPGRYVVSDSQTLDAAVLRAATLNVGIDNVGVVFQSGTRSDVNVGSSLVVGKGAQGTYTMTGGTLTALNATIGESAAGTLVLQGGRQVFSRLQLGAVSGGVGTWQVEGGRAELGSLFVGFASARGDVLHGSGTVVVSGSAVIGAGSRYVLSGFSNSVLDNAADLNNSGSFEQSGGSFTGTLVNSGVYLAEHAQANATIAGGRLVNRGTAVLLSSASFSNGLANEATMDVLKAGKSLTLNGAGFDNSGSFSMDGGTLSGNGPMRNSGRFTGHGLITRIVPGTGGAFTNSGQFTQQGGMLTVANSLGVLNTGRWQLQALQRFELSGSSNVFDNSGQLVLADGRITGSGRVVNGSSGVVSGGGSIEVPFANQGTVVLAAGERLQVSGSFTSSGLVDLGAGSASMSGATLVNTGLVAGRGRIANALDNQPAGRVQADAGTLVLAGAVHNTGMLVAGGGGTLLVTGALAQQGRVQLEGGTLDTGGQALVNQGVVGGFGTLRGASIDNQGQMQFSAGAAQLHGSLRNQGQIIVTGGGVANFHGTLRAEEGSELRVSAASAAVFFESVSLATGAALTGEGTFYFEGGISVGDSPGIATVDGDVVFGQHALFRAEIGGKNGGIGHDLFTAGGRLSFGGTLQLSWLNGFQPQEGDSFDLFDWGTAGGRFASIDLRAAALPAGLAWDLSHLYSDGTVGVAAAVPEPGAALLLLGGLAALGWRGRTDPAAGRAR